MREKKKLHGLHGFGRRILAVCLALLVYAGIGIPESRAETYGQENIELTLTQTDSESGFMMIPGMPIAQDITVHLSKGEGNCFVYIQITEANNEKGYLTYQLAEGWEPLLTPDGEPVSGVYYRLHRAGEGDTSWAVFADEQIMVNPETVTKSVLQSLAEDASGESWPKLTYEAFGLSVEDGGDKNGAYNGWYLMKGENWQVVKTPLPTGAVANAFMLPEGLTLTAYDVSLRDEKNASVQPAQPVRVELPIAEGAEDALVIHVLDSHSKIACAIGAGTAVAFPVGDNKTAIGEVITPAVENGKAVFEATSFSPYYVVSGSTETLKSWWSSSQYTRYNLDANVYGFGEKESGTREFVVEPDSAFYLFVKDTSGKAVEANWAVTEDTSNGSVTLTGSSDGVGKVVRVSADAKAGDSLTFTVNGWTVHIRVQDSVVANAFDDANYPVYIGITLDAATISVGNEPRVSGNDNNDWVYVTELTSNKVTVNGSSGAYEQYKTIAPVAGSVGDDYLLDTIKTAKFLENTDEKSVKGLIDHDLDTERNGAVEVDAYIENIDWDAIAQKLLSDSSISSKLKATDGNGVSASRDKYVLKPYVIKLQTGNYIGWHINACFVLKTAKDDEWVYFDENLDEGLGQKIEFLNVPARRPWNDGSGTTASMYYVNPANASSNYTKVSVSEYVTLTNGQKLRFMGWNTMPDGTGNMYSGEGGVFNSPNTKDSVPLEANGTLYAFWDSPLDRLEIHKDLIIGEGEDASHRYQANFTFKVKLTLPNGYQVDSDSKIIAEIFNVADDSLVPNSTQSVSLQGNKKVYEITLSFNETQYGVIYAPEGTQYEVTETLLAGSDYTLIGAQNTTGTIKGVGKGNDVRFTNGWRNTTGLLRISKNVVMEETVNTPENWEEQDFGFTVAFIASDGEMGDSYTYRRYDRQNKSVGDPATVNSNACTIKLSHGESVVFSGIQEGTKYTVTENKVEEYECSVNGTAGNTAKGAIEANKTQEAAFVNTYVPEPTNGTLTIQKTFAGCTPETGESFVFTVKDESGNLVAEVVLYGAGSKTISLPYGNYTVSEDGNWSWRYTSSVEADGEVSISKDNLNPTVTFTNTRTNTSWLDGNAGVTNDFGMNHGGEQ